MTWLIPRLGTRLDMTCWQVSPLIMSQSNGSRLNSTNLSLVLAWERGYTNLGVDEMGVDEMGGNPTASHRFRPDCTG